MTRPRTWVALAAAVAATLLASRDGRTGWTVLVGAVTALLALLAIAWAEPPAGREDRTADRQRADVERILERYERDRARRDAERR